MVKENCQHIRFYGIYDGGNILGIATTERAVSYFKNKLDCKYEEYLRFVKDLKTYNKVSEGDIKYLDGLFSFDGDLLEHLKINSFYKEFNYCPICGKKLEKGVLEKIIKEDITEYRKTFKQVPIYLRENNTIKPINNYGYVYVIEIENHYKIGISKNPKKRFGEYTKLYKEPKVVVCEKVKGYDLVEQKLHSYFANKHERGEWFSLDENDIEKIKNYINHIKENGLRN